MGEVRMPTYYEIRLPDSGEAFIGLDRVVSDNKVRGEVVASLLAQAELSALKVAEQRAIAKMLKRLAKNAP